MGPRLGTGLLLACTACVQSPGGLPGLTPVDLDVQPRLEGSLDFGTVLAGDSATASVMLRNEGLDEAVFRIGAATPSLEGEVQLRPFEASGALVPGQPVELVFELSTADQTPEGESSGFVEILLESLSGRALEVLEVDWGYRVSRSGLVIEPNPLVLGPIAFGATVEGTLSIRNASPVVQDVYSLDREGGQARFSLSAGQFGGLPEVDGRGVWARLQPGTSTELPFRYTAPLEGSESKEEAIWRIGFCPDSSCQELVRLEGIGANLGPDLVVTPSSNVFFPRVPLGQGVERTVIFLNRGSAPVTVTSFQVTESPEVFLLGTSFPIELGPGENLQLPLFFEPQAERSYSGSLRIESDDPEKPLIELTLFGTGIDLPPCGFSVSPPSIEFPRTPTLDEVIEVVTVRNTESVNCLLFDVVIEEFEGVPPGTFTLPDAPIPSTIIEPGGAFEISVSFRPREVGDFEGLLRMRINNEDRPSIVVPIEGTGGEGLGIQCSSDVSVTVGTDVRLGVFENGSSEIVSRRWRIVDGPPGGANADDIFDPEPPTTAAIVFKPKIIGTYELEATVVDAEGRERSCQVEVDVRPREFQVTLTWDGAGDLDLHVMRDRGTAWFDTTEDCFFQNRTPSWALPGLDSDEDVANGPENIRVDQPVVGETYRVGVHNFKNGAGRTARVQVYCGNQSTPDLDIDSRRLSGAASGTCTSSSDFWRVAEVDFTAPGQCSIRTVDDYITGRQACIPGF